MTLIQDRLDKGILTKADRPVRVLSPWVIVERDDKLRPCLAAVKLNSMTDKLNMVNETAEEQLQLIQGAEYFTVLDFKADFEQHLVDEGSQDLLAFEGPDMNIYNYKSLPYGYINSGAVSTSFWKHIKDKEKLRSIDQVDDHLFMHRDAQSIKADLERILDICIKYQKTVNFKKLAVGQSSVKWNGLIITQEGYQADPDRWKKLLELEINSVDRAISLDGQENSERL
ncbi:MAG: hypothetical protein KVP17_003125 [Porospora cf. gigantea B]|uniref:uncharacterized protein n=1 Tax=Porospora cf. gigantea B TaxID=2853592 RepID=UPI003571B005|nr:MAG: hypothetical protein KVP17_003125 [Porospora cf. gigantea B]